LEQVTKICNGHYSQQRAIGPSKGLSMTLQSFEAVTHSGVIPLLDSVACTGGCATTGALGPVTALSNKFPGQIFRHNEILSQIIRDDHILHRSHHINNSMHLLLRYKKILP
jgi:hypothetical protein